MLDVGESAPGFFAKAYNNGAAGDFGLSDLENKWKVMLFYVADLSKVCPTEILAFSQELDKFTASGAAVIGISTDDVHTHEKFVKESKTPIKFPLIADDDGVVSSMYGVFDKNEKKARRATFIIDNNGLIAYSCASNNKVGRSTKEIYRVLRALQSDGACAVNWEPSN